MSSSSDLPFEVQRREEISTSRPSHPRTNQPASGKIGSSSAPSKKQKKEVGTEEITFSTPIIIETDHAERRRAAAAAWAELLPQLVYPLMQWRLNRGKESIPTKRRCGCVPQGENVNVITFTGMFLSFFQSRQLTRGVKAILEVNIQYCKHHPPGVCLVNKGAFSSTPIRPPKWAFDLALLEYMSQHFAYGTPDISAWCNATSSFLSSQGEKKVPSPVRDIPLYTSKSPSCFPASECPSLPRSVRAIVLSTYPRSHWPSGGQCG